MNQASTSQQRRPSTIGGKEPLLLKRGDSLVYDVQVMGPPPGFVYPGWTPTPQNITSWSFWFTVKWLNRDEEPDAPDLNAVAQITLTTSQPVGGTITVINAAIGQIEVVVPPAATSGFPDEPTTVSYDIQAKDASGNIFTIEEGQILVTPDTTRAIA